MSAPRDLRGAPRRAWLGLGLLAASWALNWGLDGLRTHLLFFPLWLGWILLLDGATEWRRGTSLAARAPRGFGALFALSVPLWWAFEAANERLDNWRYVGREAFGDVEYAVLASIAFATVVPAVLAAAELARGWNWVERCRRGPRVALGPWTLVGTGLAGLASLAAALLWPDVAYPLVWVGAVLVLEPLVAWRGGRSFSRDLAHGDWRTWIALWAGGLLTGFLWELWNAGSHPRWVYRVPGIDGPKLFEMPLPGYLGYLPFAQAVYLWKELWLFEPELLGSLSSDDEASGAQRQAPGIQA